MGLDANQIDTDRIDTVQGPDTTAPHACRSDSRQRASATSDAVPMWQIIDRALGRRSFLQVTISSACAAVMAPMSAQASSQGLSVEPQGSTELFQFTNVPPSSIDQVVVPDGYTVDVLYRWGDPINGQSPAFKSDASNSAAEQALQAGMGHDGMEFFEIPGHDPNERGVLCINHEYTDQILLFSDGIEPLPPTPIPMEKVRKSQAAHGLSIIEVARQNDGTWQVVDSPRARRITANSPMRIAGPARAIIGDKVLGTLNNCAAGRTPWGTYLTCEENIQSVFGTDDPDFQPDERAERYGLDPRGYIYEIDGKTVPVYRWWQQDPRFDLAHADCDAERFGWVVEIDPMDPTSTPVKRTALGRFRHENAEVTLAADGRVVVYMGDDQVNEFIYKYVSRKPYDPKRAAEFGVAATGGLLDDGVLHVAKFEEDGRGRWIPLDEQTGLSAAEVAVYSRIAATQVGATPMDRAEWISIHPHTGEVFASLTNNSKRTETDGANPRPKNIFGHILRWQEDEGDAASTTFTWRVFLMAGNPNHSEPTQRGNVSGDAFACPDGLKFDKSGILWIQTDISSSKVGTGEFEELGNNMMLAADPATGQVRRFLTGPRGCEITGNAMTPDRRTMFINIQHPGEPADEVSDPLDPSKYSQWPDGEEGGRPRAATIVIRKQDGGTIGS